MIYVTVNNPGSSAPISSKNLVRLSYLLIFFKKAGLPEIYLRKVPQPLPAHRRGTAILTQPVFHQGTGATGASFTATGQIPGAGKLTPLLEPLALLSAPK
jgi:hypothetical protein